MVRYHSVFLFKNINEGNITERMGRLETNITKELGDFENDISRNLSEDIDKLNEKIYNKIVA